MNGVPANVKQARSSRRQGWRGMLGLYAELTTARLVALVLFSTVVAFLVASDARVRWLTLLWTIIGTGLAALGANGLNQVAEVQPDGRMDRTRGRPLPARRMAVRRAFVVTTAMAASGVGILALRVNMLTAGLGLLAVLLYLLLYTPMKKRGPACTLAGAVCGALPPMMGWSAATGRLDLGAWVLGATLFVWQIPHFLSLAWLHRADYARGGFRVLPVVDGSGRTTCELALLYSLALIPLGLTATLIGLAGWIFAGGSLILGVAFAAQAFGLYRRCSDVQARRLFLTSVIYLPLLLGLMAADRGPVITSSTTVVATAGPF